MSSFRQCLALYGLGLISFVLFPGDVLAAQPKPWQLGFQDAATGNMSQITEFNDFLLILMRKQNAHLFRLGHLIILFLYLGLLILL